MVFIFLDDGFLGSSLKANMVKKNPIYTLYMYITPFMDCFSRVLMCFISTASLLMTSYLACFCNNIHIRSAWQVMLKASILQFLQ